MEPKQTAQKKRKEKCKQEQEHKQLKQAHALQQTWKKRKEKKRGVTGSTTFSLALSPFIKLARLCA